MGKNRSLSAFSSCPRISQSGQGARAALWAALWPDSGRPSAGPGRPFGPPLVLRGGPKGGSKGGPGRAKLRAARVGPEGGPWGRPAALTTLCEMRGQLEHELREPIFAPPPKLRVCV